MTDTGTIAAISTLADPIRLALFRFIVERGEAVSREEASEALGLPLTKVKFHLERLAAEGLLETEYRRMTGKRGPGAGRPAKLYRRSAQEFRLSLPERRYDVMGAILASAVTKTRLSTGPVRTIDLDKAIADSAYEMGRAAVGNGAGGNTHQDGEMASDERRDLTELGDTLNILGYETVLEVEDENEPTLRLRNCPFDTLAKDNRALVCGANVHYVQGALDGTNNERLVAKLDPSPGHCCVMVRRADTDPSDDLPTTGGSER